MKRKKDVIKKAVLASVLAMSLNNVVWAAEGCLLYTSPSPRDTR